MNHAMAEWPHSDAVSVRDREQHKAKIGRASKGGSTTHTARLDGVAGAWSVCSILREGGKIMPAAREWADWQE